MRNRRVLVLRLGVWGSGVDGKSVRSVRKRSPCVRQRPQPKIVAKRRTVVAFGLALGLRVSKLSTFSGIGGPGRETQNGRHFWTCVWLPRLKMCIYFQGSGHPCRATRICRHFWTRAASLRLKTVNISRIGGVLVAKRRTVVTVGRALGRRVSKVSTFSGIGGSWSRNAELSSLFGSPRLKSVNILRDRGGPGRETQICRHFWTRVASLRLKGVNRLRDRGCPGRETQKCGRFWIRVTVSGIGGVLVAKRRTVVECLSWKGLGVSERLKSSGVNQRVCLSRKGLGIWASTRPSS